MTSPAAPIDALELAQTLIRRPSVTPADAGAIGVVSDILETLGFTCRRMRFGEIENLYARRGTKGPNLCFAGHTDVVPAGEAKAWRHDPFAAQVSDGLLYGRGAVDMKSAIAAFVAAVANTLSHGEPAGSISLLITGDEEGDAHDGTVKVVEALAAEGETIDHCIVGEPTSSAALGDMIKVGRRGSLNAWITVEGVQGHVAYPDRAANPIPVLVKLAERLRAHRLDDGYPEFQPSNLEFTALFADDVATNVIPATASARLNIRFNPAHTGSGLVRWLAAECESAEASFPGKVRLKTSISGEAFHTPPDRFVEVAAAAVEAVTGRRPELSTSGGTSDARFIRALCPVIELGLVGTTMHMVDEHAPVAEVRGLAGIYEALIKRYFEAFA
ncbi:MAG TPA: succinyl-diaminopimelate desuccinylase [Caulobacteraceae bacterium]|jgi:succinyl-diaminopimelate desuccinylase|nr:succinyl-diaminopimelate desuccinylase [Caulobacteraceae bacterium]